MSPSDVLILTFAMFFELSIYEIFCVLSVAEAVYKLYDKLGSGAHGLLVAVVAVDECHEVARLKPHLRALIVAGGCSHASSVVAIDGQSSDVEHAAADAFVWFALASHAECQRVAVELVAVKASDAVAILYACEVYQVYQCVYLVQFLAFINSVAKSSSDPANALSISSGNS